MRERSEFLSEYFVGTQKSVTGLPGLIVPGDYSLRKARVTWNKWCVLGHLL